jgi:hypothetical protein
MVALDTAAGFIHALAGARSVALSSYTLHPGAVAGALAAAARRGADVTVRLERDPLDGRDGRLHRDNARTLAELRAAGVRAETTAPGEPVLHLKAAVVDGIAWLDDRNWAATGSERVVRDAEPADVAAVAAAIAGRPGADGHLATTKAGAEELEAGVIAAAGDGPLAVESESFGNGPVYDALLQRASAHRPTRLIVAGREAAAAGNGLERAHLTRLAALGVDVRAGNGRSGDLNEKLAVAAGEGWVGSANATYDRGPAGEQRDWGLTTQQRDVVDGLRAAFEQNWAAARPLTAERGVP